MAAALKCEKDGLCKFQFLGDWIAIVHPLRYNLRSIGPGLVV